ncbi:hypothetical protein [Mycobacterium cookii]|uniref:hypothetical protein n=1 Tax=Mycobacterium cookii TaxID=1775 RepID=UPI0013D04938|nr:hypothetical protein [Mycobacterium cookii]MCV7332657.1 hypothetical protein [Mycobacterium cookii]
MAAAVFGMGTAHATPVVDIYSDTAGVYAAGDHVLPNDAYDMLFGSLGSQGIANSTLDISDAQANLPGYESFTTDVVAFEQTAGDHALENLINAIDPSAFYEQTTAGVTGTLIDSGGAYLVPDSFLGYLATGLDYGLLTPTGLDYVLTPLIDILTGTPFG